MARGKHRVPTPVRLVAVAAAVLTAGGIVIAAGTAAADNDSLNSAARRAAECESEQQVGQQMVSLRDLLERLRGQASDRFAALPFGHGRDGGAGVPPEQQEDSRHVAEDAGTPQAAGAAPPGGHVPAPAAVPAPEDAPDTPNVPEVLDTSGADTSGADTSGADTASADTASADAPDAPDAPDIEEATDAQEPAELRKTPDAQQSQGGETRERGDWASSRANCDRAHFGKGKAADEEDGRNDDGDNNGGDNNGGGNNGGNDGGGQNGDEQFPGRNLAGGPSPDDFVDIEDIQPNVDVPEPGPDASVGSFTSVCGTNEEEHRNSDNFMVAPGKVNGAQHVHDYVGNLSTDAFSDEDSLDAADTTCARNDKSTYFWPVLRDTSEEGDDADENGGGLDGNVGEILDPSAVNLEFRGSPTDPVNAMPEGLAIIMGDAKAGTNGDANAKAAWSCTGFENRTTTKYPLCPQGSALVRILDFPSCWDGENLDSANHRDHIVFPDDDGSCDDDRVAVPQLRMTLTYERPDGDDFALDTFPDQRHNPITDHADFMNMMPDNLMEEVVDCINSGQSC